MCKCGKTTEQTGLRRFRFIGLVTHTLGLLLLATLTESAPALGSPPMGAGRYVQEHAHETPNSEHGAPTEEAHAGSDESAQHDDGESHDHATDHGPANGAILKRVGRFHVVAVHFPVALLTLSGLVFLVALVRGTGVRSDLVRTLFYMGSLSAVLAASLGWMHAMGYRGPDAELLETHRWWGIGTAVIGVLGSIALAKARRTPQGHWRSVAGVFIVLTAAAAGFAAHLGGSLVYGSDFLF